MDKRGIVEDGFDWERGTEMAVFRSNHAANLVQKMVYYFQEPQTYSPALSLFIWSSWPLPSICNQKLPAKLGNLHTNPRLNIPNSLVLERQLDLTFMSASVSHLQKSWQSDLLAYKNVRGKYIQFHLQAKHGSQKWVEEVSALCKTVST